MPVKRSKPKVKHMPGPHKPCGCYIEGGAMFCPLHTAAPELAEALRLILDTENALARYRQTHADDGIDTMHLVDAKERALDIVEAALKKAGL